MSFSHHVLHTMNPNELIKFSDWAAQLIKKECDKDIHPDLFYSGMSGTSLATGIAISLSRLQITPNMHYVRKLNECSHGTKVEYATYNNCKPKLWYFVDDFISSGATFNYCKDKLGLVDKTSIRLLLAEAGWATGSHLLENDGYICYSLSRGDDVKIPIKTEKVSADIPINRFAAISPARYRVSPEDLNGLPVSIE